MVLQLCLLMLGSAVIMEDVFQSLILKDVVRHCSGICWLRTQFGCCGTESNISLCNLKFRRDCRRFSTVCFIDSQTEGHMKAGCVECDGRVLIEVLVMFIMLSVFEKISQTSSLSLLTKDFRMWHKRRMRSLLAALSLFQRATWSATAKEKRTSSYVIKAISFRL